MRSFFTRTLTLATLAAGLGLAVAPSLAPSQAMAAEGPQVSTTDSQLSISEAKSIAAKYLADNHKVGMRIGRTELAGDRIEVQVLSPEGIPMQKLKIDRATGAVSG